MFPPSSDFKVRLATKEDMKTVIDLTCSEGWTYPVEYLEALRQTSPNGFFLCEKDGEIVGKSNNTNERVKMNL